MIELFVNLSNMYQLMCDMQSQKLRNLEKILSNLSAEECKCNAPGSQTRELHYICGSGDDPGDG